MAFQLPPKSLHSFTFKQAVESIYRMAIQAQNADKDRVKESITSLQNCLNELQNHESEGVTKFSRECLLLELSEELDLEKLIMFCERTKNLDLREDQFLISTQDSEVNKIRTARHAREVHLVLDNLRSAFNVGSLFRTAESFGLMKIHICGYTATPENSKAAKSALGTEDWVEWTYWQSTLECIESLKSEGFTIYALETAKQAQELDKVTPALKSALVFGNERYGLSASVLKRADQIVEIPLFGKKNSLNVGVCAGVVSHHFSR